MNVFRVCPVNDDIIEMKNSNSERDVPQRGDRRKHKCLKAKAKETKNAKKNNGGGKERVSSCKEKKEKKCRVARFSHSRSLSFHSNVACSTRGSRIRFRLGVQALSGFHGNCRNMPRWKESARFLLRVQSFNSYLYVFLFFLFFFLACIQCGARFET